MERILGTPEAPQASPIAGPVDSLSSLQIRYCRFLCIFFMMMVHIPPGMTGVAALPPELLLPQVLVVDVLGRASVTALSFISGYLVAHSLRQTAWATLVRRRFSSLVLPMAFWNCMLIGVGLLVLAVTGQKLRSVEALQGMSLLHIVAGRIFALNYGSVGQGLNFLRDIFVCVVLAWPLQYAIRRFSWLVVIVLLVVDATVSFQPIVYRGMILVAFAAGMAYAHRFGSLAPLSRLRAPALLALGVVLAVELSGALSPHAAWEFPGYTLFKRITVSLLMIDAALLLGRSRLPAAWIGRLDRSTFLLFLSHHVTLLLLWGAWEQVFGPSLRFPYLLFFLSAPMLCVLVALLGTPVVSLLPGPLQVLVHGRVATRGPRGGDSRSREPQVRQTP